MIELSNVAKAKKGKWILQAINVRIRPGVRYALVGRNGSGKSSLAKIIAGLWRPTHGKVTTEISTGLKGIWRATGFVHQEPFLDGLLTTAENLHVISLMKSLDADLFREKVNHSLRILGAWIDLDARIDRLSGGQRRLVEVIAVLNATTGLLILDEPTRNIDLSIKNDLLLELRERFDENGSSVVLCTHDRDEFLLADEYIQLVDGEVVHHGTTAGAQLSKLVQM